MERLLLESKLRGPCWIDIRNATESKKRLSHCDLEYLVDMKSSGEYNIQAAETKRASPCVNLLILNIVSVPSSDGKDTEVSALSHHSISDSIADHNDFWLVSQQGASGPCK